MKQELPLKDANRFCMLIFLECDSLVCRRQMADVVVCVYLYWNEHHHQSCVCAFLSSCELRTLNPELWVLVILQSAEKCHSLLANTKTWLVICCIKCMQNMVWARVVGSDKTKSDCDKSYTSQWYHLNENMILMNGLRIVACITLICLTKPIIVVFAWLVVF